MDFLPILKKSSCRKDFQEWIDAYWAKDIQDIFSIGKRQSFQKFAELLLANSSGIFEASKFTTPCEVTRPTIANYLDVLEATFVVHVIRPYSTHRATEIVMAPKVYGLDTGFVCYAKGINQLRASDLGSLWEHCILNEIHGHLQTRSINYWRDKLGHEIDFIIANRSQNNLTAIECKFTLNSNDPTIGKNFQAFRKLYPDGDNYVVSNSVDKMYKRQSSSVTIWYVNSRDLMERLLA